MISKYLLPVFLVIGIVPGVFAQNFNYSSPSGNLEVDIFVSNPCDNDGDGTADDNGFIQFTIVAASGGSAKLQIFSGPVKKFDAEPPIAIGESYFHNSSRTLPVGSYGWVLYDDTEGIGSIVDASSYPPIVLRSLSNLQITATTSDNTSCSNPDGQIKVDLAGGSQNLPDGGSYDYTITSDNNLVEFPVSGSYNGTTTIDFAAEAGLSGLPGGTYTITIDDNYSQCAISESFTITDPSPEIYNLTSPSPAVCPGESILLSIDGSESGVTYTVHVNGNPTGISEMGDGTPPTEISLPATEFIDGDVLTVIATNGLCTPAEMNGIVVAEVSDPITATATVTNVSCFGGSDGSIVVNASGGSSSYTYSIDGGATYQASNIFSGLSAGTYSINILDDAGCEGVETFEISQPEEIVIDNVSSTQTSCVGSSDGSITIAASGGTGILTYELNPGAIKNTTGEFADLGAGNYTVTVTDENDCGVTSGTINVTSPNPIIIDSESSTAISCLGLTDGTVTVAASGGTGNLTYTISPGGTSNTTGEFTGLGAGDYTVSVTDENNCGPETSGSITVAEPTTITINEATSEAATCNGSSDGSITVSASGGTGDLTYTITPGETSNTTGEFTGLSAESYTVSVTDENNCNPAITESIEVTQPDAVTINETNSEAASCPGETDGRITVIASGGTGVFTYTISPGGTSNTTGEFTGLSAGDYTVSVTDENNCGPETTGIITVTEPTAISIDESTSVAVSCNGKNDGSIIVAASGGTGILTYTISPGGASNTTGEFTGLGAGDYTVSITDENNCGPETTGAITITEPIAITIDNTNTVDASCNGSADGSITVAASGGTGNLTYSISPGGASNITGEFTGLGAGDYIISVTDENNCGPVTTGSINIAEPPVITIDGSTSVAVSCSGDADGSVTVTASGGTGILTYTISPGGASNNTGEFTGLGAGDYTVSITDENNCGPAITGSITVAEPAEVIIGSESSTDVSCFGENDGTVTIEATGGTGDLTYTINPGAINNTTGVFTGLSAGDYTVSVDDQNNCGPVTSGTLTVAEPTELLLSHSGDVILDCAGDTNSSGIFDASGGTSLSSTSFKYNFNIDENTTGGDISISNSRVNLSNAGAGIVTVTVTDKNGCTATSTLTISEPANPLVLDNSGDIELNCAGDTNGSGTFTASGGDAPYTFDITENSTGATITLGNASVDFTNAGAGELTVTVTDANSCATISTIIVNQPADPLQLSGTGDINLSCFGDNDGSGSFTASGGTAPYTFAIDNNTTGATITEDNTSVSFTAAGGGEISITVTDDNNCSFTSTITVMEPAELILSADVTNVSTCEGSNGAIDLTVNGGVAPYAYSWSNGETSEDLVNLPAGAYEVTVTDANGCEIILSETITAPETPTLNISTTQTTTCGGSDGAVASNVSGGTEPYTYEWSNGATTADISDVPAGEYKVVVTDASGCTISGSGIVNDPSSFIYNSEVTDVSTCGGNNGAIDVTISGGTAPFQFSWNTGDKTEDLEALSAGEYTITVKDANGCTYIETELVQDPAGFSLNADVTDVSSCEGSDGAIDLIVDGGTAPYTYSWDTGQDTENLNNLTAGTYTVTVTDAAECSENLSVTVNEPPVYTLDAVVEDVTDCGGSNGAIDLVINGGVAPYAFSWDNGETTEDLNGLPGGDYSVTVTDDNGCVANATFTVGEPSGFTLSASVTDVSSCGGADGAVDLLVSGGIAPFTYNWDNGEISEDLTGISAGIYTVTVTDATGCSDTYSATVSEPASFTLSRSSINTSTCDGSDGSIDLTVTGGVGAITYSWSNGADTEDINNLTAGTYTVTVTDGAGCSESLNTTVSDPTYCYTAGCSLFSVNFDNTNPECGKENGVVRLHNLTYNGSPITDYRVSLYRIVDNDTILDIRIPNPENGTISGRRAGDYYYEVLDYSRNITCDGGFALPYETTVSADTVEGTVQHVVCYGAENGSVQLTVSDSETGTYFYSIDGGTNWITLPGSRRVTGLSAGFNTILVGEVQQDNCPAEVQVNIVTVYDEIKITRNITSASCDNNDGAIEITSVTGGSGSYSYKFQGELFSQLPEDNTFKNLDGGTYIFVVVDGNADCEKEFTITVPFPGLVQFTTNPVAPDCSSENADNGKIEVIINQSGIFDVGISEEMGSEPAEFFRVISEGNGSIDQTFENLDQGNYYITVVASGSVCPNRRLVTLNEGPKKIDFKPQQLCINNELALRLNDVTGERTSPLNVEISRIGSLNPTHTAIFEGIPAGDYLVIENTQELLGPGDYQVRIVQEQDACGAGEKISSASKRFTIAVDLQAEVAHTTISLPYPEDPDGSITLNNFTGGYPDYLISATLASPANPLQSFVSDFDTVRFNRDMRYEYSLAGLPAGTYQIEVMDSLGCFIVIEAEVHLNTNLFIPNVFTPNGDGKNDTFFIRNLPDSDAKLIISNRWGKEVYRSDNYKNNWDGNDALEGIFYYQLNVNGETYNGWLQLVKGRIE